MQMLSNRTQKEEEEQDKIEEETLTNETKRIEWKAGVACDKVSFYESEHNGSIARSKNERMENGKIQSKIAKTTGTANIYI